MVDEAFEALACAPGTTFTAFGGTGSLPGARTVLLYDVATDSVLMLSANRTPANLDTTVVQELGLLRNAETPTP